MKKLYILLLFVLCTPLLKAQNFTKLIDKYKGKPDVTVLNLDKKMLSSIGKDVQQYGIEEIQILSLDECDKSLIQAFNKDIEAIKPDGEYETLVKSVEEDEFAHILIKAKDHVISEMVILSGEEDEGALVWLKGSLDSNNLGFVNYYLNK